MNYISAEFWLFYMVVFGLFWLAATGSGGYLLSFWLVLSSLVFYASSSLLHLALLLGLGMSAWAIGLVLSSKYAGKESVSVLWIGIIALLLPLILFKYADFWAKRAGWLDGTVLMLPLGISFFSFQNVSYVVDRWRGVVSVEKNPIRYLTYIAFFPQLIAGPIVTAKQFLPQLEGLGAVRNLDLRGALWFILSGCFKKAVIADSLAGVVDPVFAQPSGAGAVTLMLAAVGYSLQIYCDFSGYSDIAIGLGKTFGIELPRNFRFPYSAASFQDFWRRWHITLSTWLRDYLYIPLGGSRNGRSRMFFALLATMLLGGLWHGAHWNFILWGAGHGLLLCVERFLPGNWQNGRIMRVAWRCVVLLCVVLLWVPFRTGGDGGFAATLMIYGRMFAGVAGPVSESLLRTVLLAVAALVIATLAAEKLRSRVQGAPALPFACLAVGVLFVILLAAPGGTGFIYFVF